MKNNYEGSPEEYMSIPKNNPKTSGEIDIDALNCALSRAKSISYLIQGHFGVDGTKWNNEIMSNACWTLEGLLDQIEILLDGK